MPWSNRGYRGKGRNDGLPPRTPPAVPLGIGYQAGPIPEGGLRPPPKGVTVVEMPVREPTAMIVRVNLGTEDPDVDLHREILARVWEEGYEAGINYIADRNNPYKGDE